MYTGVPLAVLTLLSVVFSIFAKREKLVIFWLLFSCVTHILLEGSYSIYHKEITADTISNITFTEMLTKEVPLESAWDLRFYASLYSQYAQYDKRYSYSEPLVVFFCWTELVEGIMSIVMIYAVLTRATWRHPLQLVCSSAQFYGTILYFFSPVMYGTWDTVMTKNPIDLYIFVFSLNGLWILAPTILIIQSFLNICPRMHEVSLKQKKMQ